MIKIKGKEYNIRYGLKTLFVFETIAGHPFENKTLADSYLLAYSCLLASNPEGFLMTFDEFIEACDEDPQIFTAFLSELETRNKLMGQQDIKKKVTEL